MPPETPENYLKIIALDGAAATGKSSTALALAKKLDFLHVDTGSHFRILTYHLLEQNISAENSHSLVQALKKLILTTSIEDHSAFLEINSDKLSKESLRSFKVNQLVSKYASIKLLRDFLLIYQRSLTDFASDKNYAGIVVEGRDIGSIVFPNTPLKIFLYADEEIRINRRLNEGQKDVIKERDAIDKTRKLAPLTCSPDALRINTANHSLDEVVALILKEVSL